MRVNDICEVTPVLQQDPAIRCRRLAVQATQTQDLYPFSPGQRTIGTFNLLLHDQPLYHHYPHVLHHTVYNRDSFSSGDDSFWTFG
jgi:hypothetical protein